MKKIPSILLLLLAFFSCARQIPVQEEDASRAVSDHLSSGQVNAIAEDALGQIWMGTSRGLNRFDGKFFHQFFHSADTLSLPDNHVTDLKVGPDGTLWVATWSGLARMDGNGRFNRIAPEDPRDLITYKLAVTPEGDVFVVCQDQIAVCRKESGRMELALRTPESYGQARLYSGSRNTLWVVSVNDIYCLDTQSLELEVRYSTPHPVTCSQLTKDGILCLAGSRHFSLFDTRSRQFQSYERKTYGWPELADCDVDVICEPKEGKLLFVTSDGMCLYDRNADVLLSQQDEAFPYKVPDFKIQTLFPDSNGLLWFGAVDQGYAVSAVGDNSYGDNPAIREFFYRKSIASIAATPEGNLWVSTKRDGLFYCEVEAGRVEPVSLSAYLEENPLGIDYCNRIMVARDGSLWLCLLGNATVLHMRYRNGRLELIRRFRDILTPDHLLETSDGTVWIGGVTGMLYRCTPAGTEAFTPFGSGKIHLMDGLLEWDRDRVLITSSSGGICLIDQEGKIDILSDQAVFPPFRDGTGRVWACVDGYEWGIITDKGLQIQAFPPMKAAYASSAVDKDGIFWVGTNDGLVRMDPATGGMAVFSEEDGIAGNEFADACATMLPDGHVVFGGPMGLTLFTPLTDVPSRQVPLCFQELKVHNKLVSPGPDAPIDRPMSEHPSVLLNHLQNSFSISYAALDYINGNRINYRYRLEGLDPYWIEAGREHEADYSNIPAGRYTFRVQATDSVGSLTDCEAVLSLRVKPDPWRSWWAILLYCMAGLGLLFLGVYQGWLRKQKDQEAEELSRLNAMQMNFFANVAHEFRTPLTMIAGPVSALSASERIAGQDRKMLSVMQRSVNWMLHLVNQILDFNRLEGDRLALKVAKQDIVPAVKEVLEVFQANAQAKGITLLDQVDGGFLLWMDADKVTKILMNLLSNALKFTPSGGQIEVSMDVLSRERASALFPLQEKDTDNRYVYLSVKDTGPGIPEEQLERIFERFYQLKRGQVALGSGIGLYYSRSLATIHHGYLKAWNRTDGPQGAVFGLLLPASTYTEEEKAGEISQQKLFPVMGVEDTSSVDSGQRRKILVVDDDVDIANYLKVMLQPQYEVETCFDVDSALETMAQEAPDLVLSDVMMPGKSGFDLCDAIKQDIQLCHIPVILVTAMAQVASQVEGLGKGADAYVTKPFDPAYLLALAGSLMENREKLRSQLGRMSSPSEVEDTRMAPQDKSFMKELYRLMDEELSNPELDVTLLSEKLRISRSKFYYKVKGLTGENPGEFFRRYKLNKAAGLLLEGKYNISEVADHTGFSSLSYFSSCFKKQFGVPPSEYKG